MRLQVALAKRSLGELMNFELAGPFKLKCYRGVVKKKESREQLLKNLKEWDEDLPSAHGCYVFAIRAGKGWTPYYAGQALRRTIFAEATHVDKLQKYNEVLADYERGTPVLFFLPWVTDGGERYRRLTRRSSSTLDFLEDSPSRLASVTPSQHLESDFRFLGNPLSIPISRSTL
jgi:hypothetical protein